MANIRKFKNTAKKLGAAVFDRCVRGHHWTWVVDSPDGMAWAANGCHTLVIDQAWGPKEWLESALDDVIERMELGLHPCDDAECEYCHP
jgi:hypothetical protein